jgi:AcrR family transcriptional regulator
MEQKIIDAATRVFIRKGKEGTSMQDIAGEAGINRTLLNYYFRSKEKLFMLIFERVFLDFIPAIAQLMNSSEAIHIKIEKFIDEYSSILLKSPLTHVFVMQELNANPERLVALVKARGINPERTLKQIQEGMEEGSLRIMDPRELIINLLSLIVFPFAGSSMIKGMLFRGDTEAYNQFLKQRIASLKTYFMNSIQPTKPRS